MKLVSKVALFLLAAAMTVMADDHAQCVSSCQSHTGRSLETTCVGYRDRLPRPALYNNCVEAYRTGSREACSAYCNQDPNAESHLTSTEALTCDKYRAVRPKDSQGICLTSFRAAINAAKVFVASSDALSGSGSSSQQASAPAPSPKVEKKPELKIKDVKVEGKPKSVLEAAREEALAAAQASRDL
ncbi:hypothetical protein SDRG_13096 [Saprolegnia diclina VS20]|uniref:Secreted protein n=1 Tax=Saprolegnia diclina (strain VS20) TaxID=1156394 RepID=T0RAL1_SAPDV|nr:hypothetical protein SDRG_13096 [Saprolegnia diclina VS20]EQC29223.1 hypothetical protein SDRG_13096 [Saprolegnia diclina VS20]|eukprot:XP_008617401.1 hypothetical protein SDRG_13096 [Saprolegnia diclina VS20]